MSSRGWQHAGSVMQAPSALCSACPVLLCPEKRVSDLVSQGREFQAAYFRHAGPEEAAWAVQGPRLMVFRPHDRRAR